ncbi:MAG: hypothetical protein AAF611_11705 [Bacteroidota bacterium]
MHTPYYKPSGKFNPISFLYLIIAVFIAVPILEFVYAYAILYIPIVYVNILCVAGIAFGLGFVANFVVGMGKVRNKPFAFFIGLIVGLAGLYCSWLVWLLYHVMDQSFAFSSFMVLVENPAMCWEALWEINALGTWSVGRTSSSNISGTMLTVVWGIEAAAMILTPLFFAYSKSREPFIENDDVWANITKIGPFEFITDKTKLKKQLETKNYQQLLEAKPLTDEQNSSHAIFTLYHNKKRVHGNEFYVSVSNMKERITKKGNVTHDESVLIQFVRVPAETGKQLLAKIGTSAEAPTTENEELSS